MLLIISATKVSRLKLGIRLIPMTTRRHWWITYLASIIIARDPRLRISRQRFKLRKDWLVAFFHKVELGVLSLGKFNFDSVNRIQRWTLPHQHWPVEHATRHPIANHRNFLQTLEWTQFAYFGDLLNTIETNVKPFQIDQMTQIGKTELEV